MDIKHALKNHAYQNVPLNYEEAFALGVYALRGCKGDQLAQIQSIAALCALHTQATYAWKWTKRAEELHGHDLPHSSGEQIAGICAAVFMHDMATSEFGFLSPDVPCVMDNCGMGGDLVLTANVSTIAALIAAAAGIPMCKHGSPANADKGRHGSSDFVEMLGIDTYPDKASLERAVATEGFGYCEALDTRYKHIHLQTHAVAQLPHMNDIIGPVTYPVDPTKATRKVIGINHMMSPRVVAEAYRILNERGVTHLEHGLFVRGFADEDQYQGMDEVSICAGGTRVAELRHGEILEYSLSARDFGLPIADPHLISPNGISKGEFSMGILRGEVNGPALDMVLANAAILFKLAGHSDDLKECVRMAAGIHSAGLDYRKALTIGELLPKSR